MLVIRLTRKGKKNQPFFRVVVIDKKRSSKGGRAVEVLGYVDPLTKRKSLKKERVLYWISKGAKPSETMHNLLVKEKIIKGKKINVSKKSKKAKQDTQTQIPPAKAKDVSSVPESKSEIPAPAPEKPAENQLTAEKPIKTTPVA